VAANYGGLVAGAPSTQWREDIAPDEDERFERYALQLRETQRHENRKGPGRGLHRKTHAAGSARLEIASDVPTEARSGIAALPGVYEALFRFSNGLHRTLADGLPDLRGLAVKVLGVPGRKVIPGLEDAPTQDFLAINVPSLPFADVDDFMRFASAANPPALALPRLVRAFGPLRTASLLNYLRGLGPPASLATIPYYSAAPIAWGEYAAKYAFFPRTPDDGGGGRGGNRLGRGLAALLREGDVEFDFAVQLFRDSATTPIEDASTEWLPQDAPFVTVGRLTLLRQDLDSAEGSARAAQIDALSFDPWHALEAHRPLGNIMRARGKAYYASITERGAAPEPVEAGAGVA
jgi:hypothetical protein